MRVKYRKIGAGGVEEHLPRAVRLLFPDHEVFAFVADGSSLLICETQLIFAAGVPEVSGAGDPNFVWMPGQFVIPEGVAFREEPGDGFACGERRVGNEHAALLVEEGDGFGDVLGGASLEPGAVGSAEDGEVVSHGGSLAPADNKSGNGAELRSAGSRGRLSEHKYSEARA